MQRFGDLVRRVLRWWRGERLLTAMEFGCRVAMPTAVTWRAAPWRLVLRRDPCVYCGGPSGTLDHIRPRKHDGPMHWENLAASCRRCNAAKGHSSLLWFLVDRRGGVRPEWPASATAKTPAVVVKRTPDPKKVAEANAKKEAELKRLLRVALAAQSEGKMGPQKLRRFGTEKARRRGY